MGKDLLEEDIVEVGGITLKRSDFMTLGLDREVEATTGELIKLIEETLKLSKKEMANLDFVIDVMLPETVIQILQKLEGFRRFRAEQALSITSLE
ncbi:hypothetical protein SKAU_G00063390 [Synaphobranchus kaupii]|uniref:Uncharacterized protein n=1 Tax=Synaphobranchus kaupii TaxID=118154 RepID=A0A9Q1G6H1_SYNKA|nr:hypothetical protein SKAU_G00063390 [Synaphobranchus kaupii]